MEERERKYKVGEEVEYKTCITQSRAVGTVSEVLLDSAGRVLYKIRVARNLMIYRLPRELKPWPQPKGEPHEEATST